MMGGAVTDLREGCLPGCRTQTIYVPRGEPVPGRMDLPEGWYCLPVPQQDE